jgi:hypothetical protein
MFGTFGIENEPDGENDPVYVTVPPAPSGTTASTCAVPATTSGAGTLELQGAVAVHPAPVVQ